MLGAPGQGRLWPCPGAAPSSPVAGCWWVWTTLSWLHIEPTPQYSRGRAEIILFPLDLWGRFNTSVYTVQMEKKLDNLAFILRILKFKISNFKISKF